MAFTLKVYFSFLCTFVPERSFDDLENPPTWCDVLLQDLSSKVDTERPIIALNPERRIEQHVPTLAFKKADCRNWQAFHGEEEDEKRYFKEDNEIGQRAIYFEREALEILVDNESTPQTKKLKVKNGQPVPGKSFYTGVPAEPILQPPNQAENEFLFWLSNPKRWKQPIKVHPAYRQGRGRDGAPLIGRVRLSDGLLYTDSTVISDKAWKVGFQEGLGSRVHQQYLALQVIYKREHIENRVRLKLSPFQGGDARFLELKPSNGASEVKVYVRNCEVGEDFGPVNPYSEGFESDRDQAVHHQLGKNPPSSPAVPEPPARPNSGEDGPCSPVTTGGYDDD